MYLKENCQEQLNGKEKNSLEENRYNKDYEDVSYQGTIIVGSL